VSRMRSVSILSAEASSKHFYTRTILVNPTVRRWAPLVQVLILSVMCIFTSFSGFALHMANILRCYLAWQNTIDKISILCFTTNPSGHQPTIRVWIVNQLLIKSHWRSSPFYYN